MRSVAEMPYHIGLKVKIYPSAEQKRLIAVNDGARRAVYNFLVACNNEIYRLKKCMDVVPAYLTRMDYLRTVSKTSKGIKNALPYLYGKDVDDQTVTNTIKNYKNAWKNQRERHTGVPTFKKKSYEQSYQTNAHYREGKDGNETSNVRFMDKNHVTLPKLGYIRFGGSPKIIASLLNRTADTRIGTIMISRDSVGEYWASFQIASEEPFHEQLPKTGSKHGIDLNLLDLVNGSDGSVVANRRFGKTAQDKLTKQQHKLSRMQEQAKKQGRCLSECKNYQEQRRLVAKTHRQIARQRADYLNVISKREVENQDFIVAENLKVRNLVKNHCLAKAISDAGWRKLLTMLQYKAGFYGKTFITVDPKSTTQTCSSCGYVLSGDEKLTLADREWTCPNCGARHDRDENSAKNILQRGLQAAGQS